MAFLVHGQPKKAPRNLSIKEWTMKASKEFEALMAAQEAIRLWVQAHPRRGPSMPDYLSENLRRAQEAHEAVKQKVLRNEANRQ